MGYTDRDVQEQLTSLVLNLHSWGVLTGDYDPALVTLVKPSDENGNVWDFVVHGYPADSIAVYALGHKGFGWDGIGKTRREAVANLFARREAAEQMVLERQRTMLNMEGLMRRVATMTPAQREVWAALTMDAPYLYAPPSSMATLVERMEAAESV